MPIGESAEADRFGGGLARLAGDLLGLKSRYSAAAAIVGRLPLRKFKISDLVVHPYNVRPASAHTTDLVRFSEQLRAQGQQDPIHVVPYLNGWAIMEGQRRWLAAPGAGITELDGWEHPAPEDPFEVYAFGQMIHESRNDTTAFDQAVVWGRMLDDGLFATPSDLAKRAQVDASRVSRSLAILKVGSAVLDQIRQAPDRFTDKHLYAIFKIYSAGGEEEAVMAARSVVLAAKDKPASARKLEARAAAFAVSGKAPTRGRRRNSVPIIVRAPGGRTLGAIKAFRDGRLEFTPDRPLPEEVSERLAEAVKALFVTELRAYFAEAVGERLNWVDPDPLAGSGG